ncbi:MAG: ferredoxin [Pseudomonadota bacterium]|nr:ferredoxin [Pseudomonadota bacterium]
MTATETAAAEDQALSPEREPETTPHLLTAVKDAKATRELMFTLRHFHLGDPAAKGQLEPVCDDCLPALLAPFRDISKLRYDYPLFLFSVDTGEGDQTPEELACPLAQLLREVTADFAPGDDMARTLKDHLSWLEWRLRQKLRQMEGPIDAPALMAEAGEALQAHLKLDETSRERLEADLKRLLDGLPAGGNILGYGRYAALHLLVHAIRSRVMPRRARFQTRIGNCIQGLKELLEVDWVKSAEAIEPRGASDRIGPAAALFDPDLLSDVMDHSQGTRRMAPERKARIEQALATLEGWQPDPRLVRFVHGPTMTCDWLEGDPTLAELEDADPCARATAVFDEQAAKLARAVAALHIAQMEIDGIYDPVIHEPWFEMFNWEGFSHEELLLVPAVIAVESAERAAGVDLRSFSRLLSSGRPVQVLIRVQAHNNPRASADENPFASFRIELGYLGIGHRQAAVSQSSAARHQHLLQCYLSSLDATRTSLHIINTGLRPQGKLVPLNAWLVAGAAIESRAHPFFRINPEAGDSAATRMAFDDNPQERTDWPVHRFRYRDENGSEVEENLAFTFADYALLIERLRDHFRLIPPGCDSVSLVSIQEYLAMDPEDAHQLVPFVWAVDGNAILHRVVVSRELAMVSLDRRNYWRTLQEMAGVRNRHVDLAVEKTRAQEREFAAAERTQLQGAHAEEVERVRNEAAGEALQRLTDVLLGMDMAAVTPGGLQSAAPATAPLAETETEAAAEAAPAEPEAAAEEEDELSFDEPWIDTPLCTSCNDCLEVNPLMFLYNENKQAYIGDLGTATFTQLVQAAELCPAKCIHPGKPLNPDEPGLDELMERAAPFNQ